MGRLVSRHSSHTGLIYRVQAGRNCRKPIGADDSPDEVSYHLLVGHIARTRPAALVVRKELVRCRT